LTGTNPKVEG